MALRGQPYIPLYVQDFMTDEKLNECSAESTGVYIRIMCVMHKSETYGMILLKQKDKREASDILNFASKLQRHMPYPAEVIERALTELIDEGVLIIEGDSLIQKRMVRDEIISSKRAESGSKGGKATQSRRSDSDFAKASAKAKSKANSEYEYEYEIESEVETVSKKEPGRKQSKIPPSLDEVSAYCAERKNGISAEQFIDFYTARGWLIGKASMKDWKAAMRTWERNGFSKQQPKTNEYGLPRGYGVPQSD